MERENVKALALPFPNHCLEAARPFRPFVGTCTDEQKSFDEFIRQDAKEYWAHLGSRLPLSCEHIFILLFFLASC
jgi:hypothetical protein